MPELLYSSNDQPFSFFDYEHHFIEHEHVSARREKRESLRNRTNCIPRPRLAQRCDYPCQSVFIRGDGIHAKESRLEKVESRNRPNTL